MLRSRSDRTTLDAPSRSFLTPTIRRHAVAYGLPVGCFSGTLCTPFLFVVEFKSLFKYNYSASPLRYAQGIPSGSLHHNNQSFGATAADSPLLGDQPHMRGCPSSMRPCWPTYLSYLNVSSPSTPVVPFGSYPRALLWWLLTKNAPRYYSFHPPEQSPSVGQKLPSAPG